MNESQKPLCGVNEGKNNKMHMVWFYLSKVLEETKITYSDINKISSCLIEEWGYEVVLFVKNSPGSTHFTWLCFTMVNHT